MTTTEKNAVIASFMGITEIVETNGIVYKDPNSELFYEIKYHSDWNWLMPVVEKIRSIQECSDFNINFSCDCKIECEDYGMVFEEYCSNKVDTLQATYNTCFQFIQWHNQQTQNP